MKVAVCISGQPRYVEKTYPLIYKNIIEPNNADVFIHLNFDECNPIIEKTHLDKGECISSPTIVDTIKQLYKPLRCMVEPPKEFIKPNYTIPEQRIDRSISLNTSRQWSREQHKHHSIKQLSSMYYSIYKCNELKELYANENGINYDYVIRLRFDVTPKSPLICSKYDKNYIYYQEIGQKDNLISDWINFGSNTIMNVYASMYLMMDYINSYDFLKKIDRLSNTLEPSDTSSGFAEHYLRDLMYHMKISKRPFNINCGLYG